MRTWASSIRSTDTALLDFYKPDRVSATCDEHARILTAVQKRRDDEAQRLLRAHIEQSKIEVREITLDMLHQARNRGRAARVELKRRPRAR